jgi:FK506-binding protein 1
MRTATLLTITTLIAFTLCQAGTQQNSLNDPVIETLVAGDGKSFPSTGQSVVAHYRGTLLSGKEFDSSYSRNDPFSFQLGVGQVIKCWDYTIAKLSVGQKVKVTCPSEWAYGARGAGGLIPPNADLIFEIELLSYK